MKMTILQRLTIPTQPGNTIDRFDITAFQRCNTTVADVLMQVNCNIFSCLIDVLFVAHDSCLLMYIDV